MSFAFNNSHLPVSTYNPASTKLFRYGFSPSALSEHCPSWSTCFELELFPRSCVFFQHELWLWFCNTICFRTSRVMLYPTLVNWFCWKMTWQKWVLFKWTKSDWLWGHTKSCIGTVSKWHAMLWEESSKGPGVFEGGASLPPTPHIQMWYVSTAYSFILIQLCCCVFSRLCFICSFHSLLPRCLYFPYITSPPSQVFSPE